MMPRLSETLAPIEDKFCCQRCGDYPILDNHQVWARIRASGVRHHYAYDLGMPRVSCCFCIFAPREALLLAGKHNPELLAEYVRVERKNGHTLRHKQSLGDISDELARGAGIGAVPDWKM